jgi:aminoglycoside phosphotransferase (APT) family kinase protein
VDGAHLIAKEYLRTDEPDAADHEFRALRLVEPLDIAPKPVFFDPPLGRVVVYAFLEGSMWDRRPPAPAELARLAELWIELHALPATGLWLGRGQAQSWAEIMARLRAPVQAYSEWVDNQAPSHRRAAHLCREALERGLTTASALLPETVPLCFCRSDSRFANVIARPDGRLGLVDWEDSGLRDPAREVADLLLHPNQEDLLTPRAWEAFLAPYLASRRPDPGFHDRLRGCLAIFPVFWLGVLLREGLRRVAAGTLDGWLVNGLPPNERLRRYLARCRAWPELDPSRALVELADVACF